MRGRELLMAVLLAAAGCGVNEAEQVPGEGSGSDTFGAAPAAAAAAEAEVLEDSPAPRQLRAGAVVTPDEGTTEQATRVHGDRPQVVVKVNTGAAIDEMTAEVDEAGRLMVDGDIVLGTIDRAQMADPDALTPFLALVRDTSARWPSGRVPYVFSGFNSAVAEDRATMDRIEAAMDHIAQRTPVRFAVRAAADDDYIKFVKSTDSGVSSSGVGKKGNAQEVAIWKTHSRGVIAHELLHALGSWHEQSRSDRDSHLTVNLACVESGREHNFNRQSDSLNPESYDFASIMHYDSNSFCKENAAGNCICNPMERKADGGGCSSSICSDRDGDGDAEFINAQRTGLSTRDINGIYQAYGRNLGKEEAGDQFAAAMVAGDFDDDGFQDLAVGAPGEDVGTVVSGAVLIYKGTRLGLVPWRVLTQSSRGVDAAGNLQDALAANEAGDRFGAALAVGDFDGNGVDDLAVGTPGEGQGDAAGTGAVIVFRGFGNVAGDARFGLQPWLFMTQATLGNGANEAGDSFGAALAAGDLDDDNRKDDLAVGIPGEKPGDGLRTGTVAVLRGSAAGLAALTVVGPPAGGNGDHFGAALTVGDFDADGDGDLAVGAPDADNGAVVNAGEVHVFRDDGAATMPLMGSYTADALASNVAGNQFGFALAAGNIAGFGDELAIGAPGASGGRVHLYKGQVGARPVAWKLISQGSLGSNEAGDRFGAAVLLARVDADLIADLVVGAPGEKPGHGTVELGYVFVFRGKIDGPDEWLGVGHGALSAAQGDNLGVSLAVADFDAGAGADVVGGVSDHAGRAGAAIRWDFRSATDNIVLEQTITEESKGSFVD
jgi:hypothetical protein